MIRALALLAMFGAFIASGPPATRTMPPSSAQARSIAERASFEVASAQLRLEQTFALPGPPLGVTFRGPSDGFIATGSGEILHFDLKGKDLELKTVVEGLEQPRDVAYLRGRLYLTDISLPCRERAQSIGLVRCRGKDFPGVSSVDAQVRILTEGYGVVLSYDVGRDATLTNKRVVLDDLPVATSDHAVNGIVAGLDGRLYVAIGSVDTLYAHPDVLAEVRRPNKNLLGTVVSFRPDGSDLRVVARGIRNVYHLVFDDRGQLYGVDNDGPTLGGWRDEEVIRFRRGGDYGYPREGSLGPYRVRTAGPMWLLKDVVGSAGVEWGPRAGLRDGLVVGSCGALSYVLFVGPERRPLNRNHVQEVTTTRGCATVVKATPDKKLIVGSVNPSRLRVYAVTGG